MNVFWKWQWMCCDFNEWVLVKINECVLEVTMNVFWKWQWMCFGSGNECVLKVTMNVFWKLQWMCFVSDKECVQCFNARQHTVLQVHILATWWFNSFLTFVYCLHIRCRNLCTVWAVMRTSVHRWCMIFDSGLEMWFCRWNCCSLW